MAAVVEEWLELESDPGLFTMLLENIGVKGVQVEDIYDLTEEIKEEVFGFVFLFKWRDESKKNKRSQFSINDNIKSNGVCNVNSKNVLYETDLEKLNQIYFAHQVIPNSCATNALLSVLMNCHERINLGSVLNKFRDMTINMSPEKRGLALGNMPELADAHNKRARYLRSDNHNNSNNINNSLYHSVATSLNTPSTRSLFNENDQEADETYHFVSYLPIGDGLYELDGLQPYPIKHSVIENENWTKVCLNIIRNRMQQKSDHYSLMAVVRDRRKVLADQLSVLNKNRSVLQQALVQMEQHDLIDQSSNGTKKEAESVVIDNVNNEEGLQKFAASDSNAGEISSNNSESSGKFNNGKIKTRTSSRVSMRNQRKMETLKKSTEINISTVPSNDDSRSEVPNIILKNEERVNSNSTSLDILKPISIDITSNGSFVDQNSLDNLTNSTNSGRSNRNSSKYPTRSSTKRDTLASNSLAYSRSNTSPNQSCETELSNIDFKFPTFSPDQLKHLMQVVDDTIKNCKSKMSDEIEKRKKYITDDMRRSFNYDDFIHAFLFALKKQGLLEKLLEEQRQKLISKKPTKRPYRSSTTSKRLKLITNQDSTLSRKISKKSLSMRKRGKHKK